jgi:hypothetical protein
MRSGSLAILGILVASSQVAHAESKTVSWFLAHPDARDRVHKLCMNNPGEARHVPDCLNAATAVEQADMNGVMRQVPPTPTPEQLCAQYGPAACQAMSAARIMTQ